MSQVMDVQTSLGLKIRGRMLPSMTVKETSGTRSSSPTSSAEKVGMHLRAFDMSDVSANTYENYDRNV